ncbi:MAG: glycosyltransferase [Roseburia sp.]|nr:glycosyltransferase [Roseburia sp.]MCM1242755.1 glycosyltransferase [Roseburia sp.]
MHPISVCIIAKNEEKRIEKCLSSIKPYGFEIVVVDTGSTDRTKEIAARYADKVLDFVWCDDFSAARNFSLQAASNNWIFMLDCDEWIKIIDVEELNYFRKNLSDSVGVISRDNLVTVEGRLTLNNTDRTERFFNRKLYHYSGIIHEQLVPIRGNDFPCLLLHTTIEHTGYDMTPEEQLAKGKRNLSLLQKQLVEEGESPYIYYQLGKGCEILNDYTAACEYYGKGLSFDVDPELAYVQAMVTSYGNSLLLTGQEETALGFEAIYDAFSSWADFVYLMGRIYMANELYPQAIEQFHKATTIENCKFHGANSFLSFYHIGLICDKLGDTANAALYYGKCGNYPPALQKLEKLQRSKRLIMFGSDIFILQYIMEQYRDALVKAGCEVFTFPAVSDHEAFTKYAEQMFLFHAQGLDAVITFNNRGFQMLLENGVSIWDEWNVPCYNLLVDHPMYYFDSLDRSPAKGVLVCADKNHAAYAKRFYPTLKQTAFLPTAGEELHPDKIKKPIANRTIEVLFIGSYKYHAEYTYDALDEAVMDYLIGHPHETVERAVEICLADISPAKPDIAAASLPEPEENAPGSDISDTKLKSIIQEHRFIETNLSSLYRVEIMRQLLEAGVTLNVYGNGWTQTDLYGHPNFICHPPVSFEEGLALMEESKVVLNQMTWFKDGASERIFNAMLQGAVCLTDDSIYLREILTDQESVVFYDLSRLEDLSSIIVELLASPEKMQAIADCGYQLAKAGHTWEHRAAQLLELLERNAAL